MASACRWQTPPELHHQALLLLQTVANLGVLLAQRLHSRLQLRLCSNESWVRPGSSSESRVRPCSGRARAAGRQWQTVGPWRRQHPESDGSKSSNSKSSVPWPDTHSRCSPPPACWRGRTARSAQTPARSAGSRSRRARLRGRRGETRAIGHRGRISQTPDTARAVTRDDWRLPARVPAAVVSHTAIHRAIPAHQWTPAAPQPAQPRRPPPAWPGPSHPASATRLQQEMEG